MVLLVVWQEHIPPDQLLRPVRRQYSIVHGIVLQREKVDLNLQLALWLQVEFAEDMTKAETQLCPGEATNNPD